MHINRKLNKSKENNKKILQKNPQKKPGNLPPTIWSPTIINNQDIYTSTLAGGCLGCVCVTYLDLKLLTKSTNNTQKSGIIPKLKDFYSLKLDRFVDYYYFFLNE